MPVPMPHRSAQPPLEWLLECCPPLRPRLFSISSSARLRGPAAHITAALVRYTTPYKRTKVGLCSAYLGAADPSQAPEVRGGGGGSGGALGASSLCMCSRLWGAGGGACGEVA